MGWLRTGAREAYWDAVHRIAVHRIDGERTLHAKIDHSPTKLAQNLTFTPQFMVSGLIYIIHAIGSSATELACLLIEMDDCRPARTLRYQARVGCLARTLSVSLGTTAEFESPANALDHDCKAVQLLRY